MLTYLMSNQMSNRLNDTEISTVLTKAVEENRRRIMHINDKETRKICVFQMSQILKSLKMASKNLDWRARKV